MKRWMCVGACALGLAAAGCNESTGPDGNGGTPTESEIVVLNSLSKTIQQFNIIDGQLVKFGQDFQLGPNFDGDTMDFIQDLWVTTTSAFGGSQIIFGAFSTGEQVVTTFPGAAGAAADAGKPTVVVDAGGLIGAFVPARARDAVFIAFPDGQEATQLAANVGTFVVRSVPAGDFIVSIDANLDDAGGTFAPLGPPRMVLSDFRSGSEFDVLNLPQGTVGATEALILTDQMAFLAGGGFEPTTFLPSGDGAMVRIDIETRGVQATLPLGGNGISMEGGRDGLLYVVRTKEGTFETDLLTFNLSTGDWVRGPNNPIQPTDAGGADISCWVASALITGEILCATFEPAAQGRLFLLDSDGTFLEETPIGVGATDIAIR